MTCEQLEVKLKEAGLRDINFYVSDTERSKRSIEVYGTIGWGSGTKEDYDRQYKLIDEYTFKGKGFDLYCWADISGFDYWMIEMSEPNYVSITVLLDDEFDIQEAVNAINKADSYFCTYLTEKEYPLEY